MTKFLNIKWTPHSTCRLFHHWLRVCTMPQRCLLPPFFFQMQTLEVVLCSIGNLQCSWPAWIKNRPVVDLYFDILIYCRHGGIFFSIYRYEKNYFNDSPRRYTGTSYWVSLKKLDPTNVVPSYKFSFEKGLYI